MKLIELERAELTDAQFNIKDTAVNNLAKKNCIALCEVFGVDDVKDIPKPNIRNRNYILDIISGKSCQWYTALFASCISYKRTLDMQELSNIAYYFACRGYLLSHGYDVGWLPRLQDLASGCLDTYSQMEIDRITNDIWTLTMQRLESIKDNTANQTMQLKEADSDFPVDLAEHLAKCSSIEAIVNEVCRIAMLGPKYRRAEDVKAATINAWNTMQKE